jgi:hypothetical protein
MVFKFYVGSAQFNFGSQRITLPGGSYVENQTINLGAVAPGIREQQREPDAMAPILENGGFENGVKGWGTGFYEGLFAPQGVMGLRFGGAVANWTLDSGLAHTGRSSLRVDHKSGYMEHRFSSFCQRIKSSSWASL